MAVLGRGLAAGPLPLLIVVAEVAEVVDVEEEPVADVARLEAEAADDSDEVAGAFERCSVDD